MKIKILLVLILSFFIIQSCASTHKIKKIAAVASLDQKTDPYGAVVSEKKHVVTISHYTEIDFVKDKIIFRIIVENGGKKPVKMSNDNISVIFKGNSNDWTSKKIHIQSLPEFMKDLEIDFYDEENRNIRDIFRRLDRTAQRIIYSSVKEMIAVSFAIQLENAISHIDLMRENYEQLKDLLPKLIQKQQTIMPGRSIIAIVPCDIRDIGPEVKGKFTVVVSVDGEEHKFTFARSL